MGEKSKKVRAICLENSEGVWSPIVQYMPTETYFLSISFSSDHTEFCLFFLFFPICSVSNLCILHFFIPSFPLYPHFSCFNLSSHHFILGTLYLSHFIFHKWQEQFVWYTTTYMFFYDEILISWFFFHWKLRSTFPPLEPKQTCVTASASKI